MMLKSIRKCSPVKKYITYAHQSFHVDIKDMSLIAYFKCGFQESILNFLIPN